MEEMQKKRADEHDQWFRQRVKSAVEEADKPGAIFISHKQVHSIWAAKRKELTQREGTQQNSENGEAG